MNIQPFALLLLNAALDFLYFALEIQEIADVVELEGRAGDHDHDPELDLVLWDLLWREFHENFQVLFCTVA